MDEGAWRPKVRPCKRRADEQDGHTDEDLGADDVETRIYPGANHGINQQEPDKARRVVVGLGGS